MIDFRTIRQTAETGLVSEWRLRQMLREGKLPGVYSGTRFYVDVEELEAQLKAQSLANAQGVTAC